MSDQFDQNDNQLEGFEEGPAIPPEQKPTRQPFIVAISIIGGIFVLALIVLIAVLLLNPNRGGGAADVAARQTQNAAIAQAATDQARVAFLQQTVDAATKIPTNTPIVIVATTTTSTPVVAVATATKTPQPTVPIDSLTKTAAALTQIAKGTLVAPVGGAGTPGAATVTGTIKATSTGLPATGIGDQAGLPIMAGIAALLLVIIFVARRLRLSNG